MTLSLIWIVDSDTNKSRELRRSQYYGIFKPFFGKMFMNVEKVNREIWRGRVEKWYLIFTISISSHWTFLHSLIFATTSSCAFNNVTQCYHETIRNKVWNLVVVNAVEEWWKAFCQNIILKCSSMYTEETKT